MKGLIIKDFINLKRQGRIIAVLIGFYVILALTTRDNTMLGGVLAVICAIFPVTAMAYDEKARWDKYALSMPVSRNDMVISKYLLGMILSVAAFIINISFNMITNPESLFYNLQLSLALFGVGILFISLSLPFMFKYGVEKARLIMMLLLFLPTAAIIVFAKLGLKPPGEDMLNRLALASPFAVILILAASVLISVRIFVSKEM